MIIAAWAACAALLTINYGPCQHGCVFTDCGIGHGMAHRGCARCRASTNTAEDMLHRHPGYVMRVSIYDVDDQRCCRNDMDGWMDGWMHGWMDGWMDGLISATLADVESQPSLAGLAGKPSE